jgi:hypothetical protein
MPMRQYLMLSISERKMKLEANIRRLGDYSYKWLQIVSNAIQCIHMYGNIFKVSISAPYTVAVYVHPEQNCICLNSFSTNS